MELGCAIVKDQTKHRTAGSNRHAAPHGPSSAAGHIGGVALNAVTLLVRLGTGALGYAALGVFFGFQVTDFDRFLGFFSLCHFIFPSYLFWVVSRCVVSVTPKGN